MSCARANILRKQKSCTSDLSTTVKCRQRRFQLQKQFSVDQSHNDRNAIAAFHRPITIGSQHSVRENVWNGQEPSAESSLRICTAYKNTSAKNGAAGE